MPRFSSPEKITAENLNMHLGDDEYYGAYVDFFTEAVKKQGVTSALEDYVFSEKANFMSGNKADEQPEMLNRLMDGILHSMIQVGHGLEFNVPGLVAEGLAWTAVHIKSSSAVMPASFWTAANQAPVASLTTRFQGLGGSAVAAPKNNVHALTILARILKDASFDEIPAADDYHIVYSNITDKYSDAIIKYAQMWTFNQNDPHEAERKVEELVYANTMMYAVGGWSKDREFNNDFFFVHFVTSAIFLYQFIEILKPASQEVFLRSYLTVCMTWWIGRGRPGFDVAGFFKEVPTNPGIVAQFQVPHKDALPKADSPKASSPNPWFSLIQEALVCPDEHLTKTLRALAHFAELYGTRAAGQEDLKTTELPGAELIDGTLFIRAAVLTNQRLKNKDVDVSMTRLGIVDASEIPPTFSAPYDQFVALIAGGDTAIRHAAEGAEDSTTRPVDDLNAIIPPINDIDTVIGIAASGRTPIGKTHGNLMVDVKSSNKKLIDRARRIFRTLHPQTPRTDAEIDTLVASCDGSVKLAAVVEKLQCSVDDARAKLVTARGIMRKAWLTYDALPPPLIALRPPRLVLAVDAGGTKCTAIIANGDGIQAKAEAGPCNFVTRGHDAALSTMSEAINRAIALLPESVLRTLSLPRIPLSQPLFAAAWIGGAGLDRPTDLESVHTRISRLLSLPDPTTLLVTNDAALLSSAIIKNDDMQPTQTKTGVVLITGTGSLAKSFTITSASHKLVSTSNERAGGWGYLLGDEGSAYWIGREAIRRALRHRDSGYPPTPFHRRVAAHLGCTSILGIISAVYAPNQFREDPDANALDADPKLRVASLCPVVFTAAFPVRAEEVDVEALEIVKEGVKGAVETLISLLENNKRVVSRESTLVLGGALGQLKEYRELLVRGLEEQGEVFASVKAVGDAAGCAIELLRRNFLASSSDG
ncbi:hypothetical protein C0993_005866 [Termitomyces sp. T159_Od127]|nr:hypothetical protein C0993_005866 [Termitomyces sp. T159_Od127]